MLKKRKVLSEKEFAIKAIEYIDEKWKGIIPNYDAVEEWLDQFLTEFHKDYYEVEFIPSRSTIEIYANEISDLSFVLDKDLPDNIFVTKVDGKKVDSFNIERLVKRAEKNESLARAGYEVIDTSEED